MARIGLGRLALIFLGTRGNRLVMPQRRLYNIFSEATGNAGGYRAHRIQPWRVSEGGFNPPVNFSADRYKLG